MVIMNNEITINPEEIRNLPDGSVTDPETIRQIALYGIKTNDESLISKVTSGFEFCGLYPHVIERYGANPINESYYGKLVIEGDNPCEEHFGKIIFKGFDPYDGEHLIVRSGSTGIQPLCEKKDKEKSIEFIKVLTEEFFKQKEEQKTRNKVFTLRNQAVRYGGTILTDENRSLIPMEAYNWVVASGIDGYIAGYNAAMEKLNIK